MIDFTVYVVDDDSNALTSTQNALASVGLPIKAFLSANDFIHNYCADGAACVILDLKMPDMTGLELIEWLRWRNIDVPVIVLSGHGNIPAVVESMRLGAVDFLEKPVNDRTLVEKVVTLFHAEAKRWGEQAKTREICDNFSTLTERERELVELLSRGLSSKQIAVMMGISPKTVENHRSHLLAKTQAPNVASLVRMKMIVGDRSTAQ